MKIIITEDKIKITTSSKDMPIDRDNMIDWSCRMAAIEAMAWGVSQLSNEMQKAVSFYRTGNSDDQKSIID